MVKKQRGEDTILKQVEAIYGDVLMPGFGISDADMDILCKEVNIVYHCAATVR